MTKDANENSENELNNLEMISRESTEDQNENRSDVSSKGERLFENSHLNASLPAKEETSHSVNVTNQSPAEDDNVLHGNNVLIANGVKVSSSVEIDEGCPKNFKLLCNENKLLSTSLEGIVNETINGGYLSENFSEIKNSTLAPQPCSKQGIIEIDFKDTLNDKKEKRVSTENQIKDCTVVLKDISNNNKNNKQLLAVKAFELGLDKSKTNPSQLSACNIDFTRDSSSDAAKKFFMETQSFFKSSKNFSSITYPLESNCDVVLSKDESKLEVKDDNSIKDLKICKDQNLLGKEIEKSVIPENEIGMGTTNLSSHGCKSANTDNQESIASLIQSYKSEKHLNIAKNFFDTKDSPKENDNTNLSISQNDEKRSTSSIDSNKDPDAKNEKPIETPLLATEKSSCEEMVHENGVQKQEMTISTGHSSTKTCTGKIELQNGNDNENSINYKMEPENEYNGMKSQNEQSIQTQIKIEDVFSLQTYLPRNNNQNMNNNDLQIRMSAETWLNSDTKEVMDFNAGYSFHTQTSAESSMMPSNIEKETSIDDVEIKTEQYIPSDPFESIWMNHETDQMQYPFGESSFIQQPENLMAAEVVKEEPAGMEIGNFLDQYSEEGDIFDSLRQLNNNVDFASFDSVFSSDAAYSSSVLHEQPAMFHLDTFSNPTNFSSSSTDFTETKPNIMEGSNFKQDKKKNSVRFQIVSRKENQAPGISFDKMETFSNQTQSSSPVYGTIKIRTPTTIQSFSFSPSVDKSKIPTRQLSAENKAKNTCLGVLRPIKKSIRKEECGPKRTTGTQRVVFAEKPIEKEDENGFNNYKVMPSIKLIVPRENSQVKNPNAESERNEKENSRIKVYSGTAGTKCKDGTGSVISYFSKAAGLIPSSCQKLEMDNALAKSLGLKRGNDARPLSINTDGKLCMDCSPKPKLLQIVSAEPNPENRSETITNNATPAPATMISSRTRSKRQSLREASDSPTAKLTKASEDESKTPPVIQISDIVDNYAAKFHNASAVLQPNIPKKDFTKSFLLEKAIQNQDSMGGESSGISTPVKAKTIAELTLDAVQELNGGQGSTVFDIMSYVRSRVSRDDVNVSQGVRETLKEAAGAGNIQLKSGRYVVTQTLTKKEKTKPKTAKRKSTLELPRRTKSMRTFRKPYDGRDDPCL